MNLRKARGIDLKTVDSRDKLKPRASKEPYWQALSSGRYLGFRPSVGTGQGTWLARFHDVDTGAKPSRTLGDFGTLAPSKRFDAAKREAEEWFNHLSGGGSKESITVRQACERYAEGNAEAAGRFARTVYNDAIAKVQVAKLTRVQVQNWRKRLEAMPALVAKNPKGEPIYRPRSAGTVNRDMVPLRAALNLALDHGDALNDQAWRVALRPTKKADGRRNIYLDKAQRRALLDHLPEDVRAFARGLCLLPLRPGALAGLKAGDFDARRGELVIERDKAGEGRAILVEGETLAMLKAQARYKLPAAPLFARVDGAAWQAYMWKDPIKAAAKKAKLPAEVVAYTLRHSTITDLVQGGLDLLTVAQVSGTSVAMIEKHYGHLQRNRAAQALAGLAL
ncbi:MAG: tyrosine-type recombinase/integrase [Thermomonas sp.]|uniref:tyrosine-type recombinase/integrase n=1 Tax=Thermomonas sp. TaxID=1971895 RepID=UPI001EBD26B3|nr:tyrosine-type recombinase/integrase [Thermomonas sp.]MBV2208204.1 tyrosine-type recombinase/integrase [Thermomonas sp.]